MSRMKMAVVGVGALGRHHARILAGLERVDLVAVADNNAQQGQQIAQAHDTRWTADYRELFGEIDAVVVAVPTFAHQRIVSEFLDSRIPVMVEKPIAADVEQAEGLATLAEQNQTLLQVGHVERFNPAYQAVAERCSAAKYIRAERFSPYAFRSTDIGVVHDLMIHDIDLVLGLVGDCPCDVSALGISILGEHEDSVQARITFQNGCIADLNASRVHPGAKRELVAWSWDGCLHADLGSRKVVHYKPSSLLLYGQSPLEKASEPGADIQQLKSEIFGKYLEVDELSISDADALTAELTDFIDCVKTGRHPVVDGRQALAAMRIADAVLNSVEQHAWNGTTVGPTGPFGNWPGAGEKRAA